MALDVICIVLRFVTRIFITEPKIWWDDWFILVSLVCILIGASGNAVEVHYGFGRPEHYLTDYQVRYYVAWTYGEWIQTMLVGCKFATIFLAPLRLILFSSDVDVHESIDLFLSSSRTCDSEQKADIVSH